MNKRAMMSLGLSALVFGGALVGCSGQDAHPAVASARSPKADAAAARSADAEAIRAIAEHDGADAVGFAERAVALAPREAGYRATLGRSYLQAGRFASAQAALRDALALGPQDGRAALNLALATIALGDWQGARDVLAAHATTIAPTDRGLALALAGDPQGAVQVLTEIARSPATGVKVRQNLALSLALAGQWPAAKIVASADLSPADVDQRLQQWAVFAQPKTPSDQVDALLGVHAAPDQGQPVALALAAPVAVAPAASQSAAAAVADAAVPMSDMPAPPPIVGAHNATPAVRFAAPHAVVQPLPPTVLSAPTRPIKVALTATSKRTVPVVMPAASTAPGDWFVQVGAYDNAAVAHDGWVRLQHRSALFAGRAPNGTTIRMGQGSFYRLSVGGFAHADADGLCRNYRRQGGRCFVRRQAGDATALWVRGGGAAQGSAR